MADKVQVNHVRVPTKDSGIELEAAIHDGSNLNTDWKCVGVVCTHPMPLLGGDMRNNVVASVCTYFSMLGATTLRFNFRGVGQSSGSGSWFGDTERGDVVACCNFLVAKYRHITKILLVGYSYGSVISSSVAGEVDSVVGFCAISYPFGPLSIMLLGHLLEKIKIEKPKYFVSGSKDNFTSVSTAKSRLQNITPPSDIDFIDDVDHFWSGHETVLCQKIFEWAKRSAQV